MASDQEQQPSAAGGFGTIALPQLVSARGTSIGAEVHAEEFARPPGAARRLATPIVAAKTAEKPRGPRESIQSVTRALSLIRELNVHNGATLHALAKAVGLPRGTVYRVMETLRQLGYVLKDDHTCRYWVGASCQDLGFGYVDQSWVLNVGDDVVNRLEAETKLNVVLTTPYDRDEMIVRIATIFRNPAIGSRTTAGMHVPMGQSCSGHSYLAHCAPDARRRHLDGLYLRKPCKSAMPFVQDHVSLVRPLAEKLLEVIQRRGYAVGHAGHDRSGRLGVVAVPILSERRVHGCLSLNFYYSSMKPANFKHLLQVLQKSAAEIAAAAPIGNAYSSPQP